MKANKEKRKWGLILFIIIIMIGTSISFVFIGFQPQNDVVKYNGIKFVRYSDRLEAEINGLTAAFSFLPSEVESISVSNDFYLKLQNKIEIDATYDSNSTFAQSIALAQHQMALTLAQYNIFVRKGFTTNNSYSLPIINCEDASENIPVVYFKQGNATKIFSDKDCVVVEASTNSDIIKAKDRLLYGILGVMK